LVVKETDSYAERVGVTSLWLQGHLCRSDSGHCHIWRQNDSWYSHMPRTAMEDCEAPISRLPSKRRKIRVG
jgi:hypothetical protein